MEKQRLPELLEYIDPAMLDYQDWVNVGMALKEEGCSVSDWENWSQRDRARYHAGECEKKWHSFKGTGTPVTGGTIVQLAKEHGWSPAVSGHELDWDDEISDDELVIVDKNWMESQEITEPQEWNPVAELVRYLSTLFESTENVGYVTESWEKDGKYLPSKGCWDRTAGELIEQLQKCKGDIGAVLGDYKPEVGAWIRFNPLDGNGIKNENVTDFRYALVESDNMDIGAQNAIIRELELPVACLVYSGGKSVHAIVRIDAGDYSEYRKRVDYLYDVCKKNGLKIDSQNRNPSRLSRMPGIMRGQHKQFLIDTNIGKESWAEWQEWIEGVNDDLPEPESMASVWDHLPELSPPLIQNVLRMGHKLLLAGPSKAGKSFALIELCIAIAEGRKWLEWPCKKGKVLYVNLELDRASCLHRFKDVYQALNLKPENLANIDIWNLRGKSVPMDKLAPKLIRRAAKKDYIAVVIDPIYKVITGDENSADQMATFCNQFDKICTELGTAVIYCHHHSKGSQGGKRAMDRASGSGVFARDPDALLDLIELELNDNILIQERNKAACKAIERYLNSNAVNWEKDASQDDLLSKRAMQELAEIHLSRAQYKDLQKVIDTAEQSIDQLTAWRIDGTLREFPKFQPVNLWFDYPVHQIDPTGALKDIDPEGDAPPWKKNFSKKKTPEERKEEKRQELEIAFEACSIEGRITIQSLSEFLGVSEKTTRRRVQEHGGFWIDNSEVGRK
ncbi:AAA family ATPase [Eubacterium limosum]|uniref:AAA family ATPase n=1 Tax=Eubacterium limosum TaxID=1736 RepID=UPI00371A75CD